MVTIHLSKGDYCQAHRCYVAPISDDVLSWFTSVQAQINWRRNEFRLTQLSSGSLFTWVAHASDGSGKLDSALLTLDKDSVISTEYLSSRPPAIQSIVKTHRAVFEKPNSMPPDRP